MKSHFFLRKRTKSKKNPKNTSTNPFQPKSQPNPVAFQPNPVVVFLVKSVSLERTRITKRLMGFWLGRPDSMVLRGLGLISQSSKSLPLFVTSEPLLAKP